MKNPGYTTRIRLAAAALGLYLASAGVWVLAPPSPHGHRPLDPFVTVLTDVEHAEAAAALLDAGALEVITPETTEVYVSRFRAVEPVSLAFALERLDPLDPRRDPWITSLPRYFRIDGRNAIYARFGDSLPRTARVVRGALGAGARVAEWAPWRAAAALGIYLLGAAIVLLVCLRYRRQLAPATFPAAVTAVLPWVPAVAAGGPAAAAPAVVLLCFVVWVAAEAATLAVGLERNRRPSPLPWSATLTARLVGLGGAVLVSSGYLVLFSGTGALVPLLLALAGSAAGPVAVLSLARRRHDAGHRPFVPLSIIPGRLSGVVGRPWARVGSLLLPFLLLLPPVVDGTVGGPGVSPTPKPAAGRGFSHDDLAELAAARQEDALPDLSDYLAHRAYQEGLLYGRAFGFPGRDEEVTLERFRQEADGAYAGFTEAVLVFDAAWIAAVLEDPPAGVTAMLAGVGRPAGVVLAPANTIYSGYSQFIQHITYVVLVLAPFLLAALSRTRRIGNSSVLEISRRRRQVA